MEEKTGKQPVDPGYIDENGCLEPGVLRTWRSFAEMELDSNGFLVGNGRRYAQSQVNSAFLIAAINEIEANRNGSGERDLHAEHIEGLRSTIGDMLAEGDGKPTGSLSGAVCAIRELREMSDRNRQLADRNAKERDQAIKERDATREERDAAREELAAIRDLLRTKVVPYDDSTTLEYAQMLATNRDFWWQSFSDTINERNKIMEERDALKVRLELERDQIRVERDALTELNQTKHHNDALKRERDEARTERDLARSRCADLAKDLDTRQKHHKDTCNELFGQIDAYKQSNATLSESNSTYYNMMIGISNRVSALISDDYEYPQVVEPTEDEIIDGINTLLKRYFTRIHALEDLNETLEGTLGRANLRLLKLLDQSLDIDWKKIDQADDELSATEERAKETDRG